MYHYAGNNPINYTDPNGRAVELNYIKYNNHGSKLEGNFWSQKTNRNLIREDLNQNLFGSFALWVLDVNSLLQDEGQEGENFKNAFNLTTDFIDILGDFGIECIQCNILIQMIKPILELAVNGKQKAWGKFMKMVGDFDRKMQSLTGISIAPGNLEDREKLNEFVKDFKMTKKEDTVTVDVQNQGKYSYKTQTIELSATVYNRKKGEWEHLTLKWEYTSDFELY